jgi:CRP-like cAMP-binding protein
MGEEFYILEKGNVEVMVYKEGTKHNDPCLKEKVAYAKFLGAGVSFGEIALLYNDRRSASVNAVENCDTWVLEGRVFKNIIIKSAVKKRNIEFQLLEKVEMFSNISIKLIKSFLNRVS